MLPWAGHVVSFCLPLFTLIGDKVLQTGFLGVVSSLKSLNAKGLKAENKIGVTSRGFVEGRAVLPCWSDEHTREGF